MTMMNYMVSPEIAKAVEKVQKKKKKPSPSDFDKILAIGMVEGTVKEVPDDDIAGMLFISDYRKIGWKMLSHIETPAMASVVQSLLKSKGMRMEFNMKEEGDQQS